LKSASCTSLKKRERKRHDENLNCSIDRRVVVSGDDDNDDRTGARPVTMAANRDRISVMTNGSELQ